MGPLCMNFSSTAFNLLSNSGVLDKTSKSVSGGGVVGNVVVLVVGSYGSSFVLERKIGDGKTCILNVASTLGPCSK